MQSMQYMGRRHASGTPAHGYHWSCGFPDSIHLPCHQVEEVFMAGDLPRVAEILSLMRKSLSLVGPFPLQQIPRFQQ